MGCRIRGEISDMRTREEKEKIVREATSDDLLETLVGLVERRAHDRFMYEGADRDDVVENFRVTRNEILKRMEASGASERVPN